MTTLCATHVRPAAWTIQSVSYSEDAGREEKRREEKRLQEPGEPGEEAEEDLFFDPPRIYNVRMCSVVAC